MKKIIFSILLIIASTSLFAETPTSSPATVSSTNFTGTYIMSHRKNYNTLEVIDLGDGRIFFNMHAELHLTDKSGNLPKGDSCGLIYLKDNKASYQSYDKTCILNFTFSDNAVQVMQPSDCYDFNVSAEGAYKMKNSQKPEIRDCR